MRATLEIRAVDDVIGYAVITPDGQLSGLYVVPPEALPSGFTIREVCLRSAVPEALPNEPTLAMLNALSNGIFEGEADLQPGTIEHALYVQAYRAMLDAWRSPQRRSE